ncbi:MAG: choice-of-anchor D domain-containing protein [Candidatus Kapaibacteriota bacterium]
MPPPYSNNYWLDVFFHPSNPNYGWICGFNGMIIRTTDGGNTWRGTTINAYHLESVHFPTLQVGYVSGVEGIFKSTDGGATWFDITPAGTRDTTFFWGCFFLNEDYGLLVGDGCNGRLQHFWLTTDGGANWSVFIANEDNTGMTDVMLYPNGLGYASSSGKIWVTSDSGRTWQIFSTSGPSLWQEEITNIGSSFLVPFSGTTCTGGGNDGGMRFTTNNGITWNSFRTGVPMFGTFLIDTQRGWACGYYGEIYYTSSGGVSWQKRNCGVQSGNLDDLWFINESNGWAVGEGIYKLSNSKGVANKKALNFGEVCIGERILDTIWFKSFNFNDASISISINPKQSDFSIVSPGSTAFIQSCDSIRIIISFNPKTKGIKDANLIIQYPNQDAISIPLRGSAIEPSARLIDTLIVLNSAKCGFTYPISVRVSSDNEGEFISYAKPIIDNKSFRLTSLFPFQLKPSKNNFLHFECTPNDTGWQEIIYRIGFSPCDTFQLLKIRVYSVSPIIQTDSIIEIEQYCRLEPLKIRVVNLGNDTLFLRKFSFNPKTNNLTLYGWSSGKDLYKNYILPNSVDTLVIYIDTSFAGIITTTLIIENNDFRTVNGKRNIVYVKVNIRVFIPKINFSPSYVNFGRICIGDTSRREVNINNDGNLEELILNILQNNRSAFIVNNSLPITLKPNGILKLELTFAPNKTGKFYDTLIFIPFNCKDTIRIVCLGEGIRTNITSTPTSIKLKIQKGFSTNITVSFFTTSGDTNKLTSISITDSIANLVALDSIVPDSLVTQFDTLKVSFNIFGRKQGKFHGTVNFYFSGICDTVISVPVIIEIIDKNIVVEPTLIDFGKIYCNSDKQFREIIVKNLSEVRDTVLNIALEQQYGQFSIETNISLPFEILPKDSVAIVLSYTPTKLMSDTAKIVFVFGDTTRNITVPIFAFWGLSKLYIEKNFIDFGELETCELPKSLNCFLTNLGNITDSLKIIKQFNTAYFDSYFLNKTLNPNSTDTTHLVIEFIGAKEPGEFVDTLIVGFSICEKLDTLIARCAVVKPLFSITPKLVELDTVWVGSSKLSSITFENRSQNDLAFKIFSSYSSSNLFFDSTFNILLKPLESYEYKFNVLGNIVGEYWDTICFEISRRCNYYDCVIIHYVVPEEIYDLTFKIGKYIVAPGESVEINVENLTPNVLLHLDTLALKVEFDKWLLKIQGCKIENIDLDSFHNVGELTVVLSGQALEKFIKQGIPISISANSMYSFPDSTELVLKVFKYLPEKEIYFNLIDGFLKVYPVCGPIGSKHLELIPSFEILGFANDGEETQVVLFSENVQSLKAMVYDVLGNFLGEETIKLSEGLNHYNFTKSKLNQTSSLVFLVFSNSFLTKFVILPIVK